MAQLVSASALGAEGPPFESEYPDNRDDREFKTLCHFFMHIIECAAINPYPNLYKFRAGYLMDLATRIRMVLVASVSVSHMRVTE